MKYNVGMYGGAFDPLHIGHLQSMIKASGVCNRLFIVLSFSRKRDRVPMEYRYRWIKNALKHLDNVQIILLEDDAVTKEDYESEDYWTRGRDDVLAKIGQPVDVVFCGSDYKGTNRYEELYQCPVVYFDRSEVPVSSTEIRENPLKYWDWIPQVARPYFVKKVLIVGSESTGKSTLTANLALAYNTSYVEEVGREVCDYAGGEALMLAEDLQEILLRHKVRELDLMKNSNKILFEDTDALTTKFYAGFLMDDADAVCRTEALADAITGINNFDLIFFLEPTVEFVQDGTRNETIAADREKYSSQIKALFDEAGLKYHCLSGDYQERYEEAKRIIDKEFGVQG